MSWQLDVPLDSIVFDCDGTLSHLEGIDELARQNGVDANVAKITAYSMSHQLTEANYAKRLDWIKPNREQVQALVKYYIQHVTPFAKEVIQIFQKCHKKIYILSAGIADAIVPFGAYFGIDEESIYAVNLQFDEQGHYQDFDHQTPLIQPKGKLQLVQTLFPDAARVTYVGDGMSDADVAAHVTRFIGYGGMVKRQQVAALSFFYLTGASFLPLLPLCLTTEEAMGLSTLDKHYYDLGLVEINLRDKSC